MNQNARWNSEKSGTILQATRRHIHEHWHLQSCMNFMWLKSFSFRSAPIYSACCIDLCYSIGCMYYYIGELIFFCMKPEFVWAAKWKQDPGQSCSCASVWTFRVIGWSPNYMQCDVRVTCRQGARLKPTIEEGRTIKGNNEMRGEKKRHSNRLHCQSFGRQDDSPNSYHLSKVSVNAH